MKKDQNKKGFTLVEVMVTLVVGAAIFTGILPITMNTITANKDARLKLYAYEDAQQELENMRGDSFSQITNHSFTVSNITGATGTITVNTTVDGATQTTIAAVTSKVAWTFHSKNESVTLSTYIYE
jgi:prepilin-type N-terminal cleavage/methylation domain-containing protein